MTTNLRATEADLEARIDAAVALAIPWLSSSELTHQTTISIRLGHGTADIDGLRLAGRTDVVLWHGETPLAVLELKRDGMALLDEDIKQGLSYARLMEPMAPLVVVTNGRDVRTLWSYNGATLSSDDTQEMSITKVFSNIASIAQADKTRAIEALLGPQDDVWKKVIATATNELVLQRSGTWKSLSHEYIEAFRIPRDATSQLRHHILAGKEVVFLTGEPLVGKSNVLHELTDLGRSRADMEVLMIDAADAQYGPLRLLANILSDHTGVGLSPDSVRSWLQRHRHSATSPLVLAIDGVPNSWLEGEITELRKHFLGSGVRLVIAADPGQVEVLCTRGGRKTSALGVGSEIVAVKDLSDDEMDVWNSLINARGVAPLPGWRAAGAYRSPWIVRGVLSGLVEGATPGRLLIGPAIPGLEVIKAAREKFDELEVRNDYAELVEIMRNRKSSAPLTAEQSLLSLEVFLIDSGAMRTSLGHEATERMRRDGSIRVFRFGDQGNFVVPLIPALFASEMARNLANQVRKVAAKDARRAARELAAACERMPLGDVIAAHALIDVLIDGLPLDVVHELLSIRPQWKEPNPGMRAVMLHPKVGKVELVWLSATRVLAAWREGSQRRQEEWEMDSTRSMKSDFFPWLVLSHLCAFKTLAESSDGIFGQLHPALLLEIGACPFPLIRHAEEGPGMVETYDLGRHGEVLSGTDIREPITQSLFVQIAADIELGEHLLVEAIARENAALLSRLITALQHVSRTADHQTQGWATDALSRAERALSDCLIAATE